MDVSIVICTTNRAGDLAATLASLANVTTPGTAELLVIDNRSVDSTRQVVEAAARTFPFPVRYLYENEAGKYAALNAGVRAAQGEVIVATDDDARFESDWLVNAVNGLKRLQCDFVGGRVLPMWQGGKPVWLNERNGMHAKVIALLDYGDEIREFGRGVSWPLGVNVAYRREVFDRIGLFDNRLGRKWGTLRNQAQREWHLRGRAAGLVGFYLPTMVVHHLVPSERLTKAYFRRWLYWHGISRALLYHFAGYDMEEPESGPRFAKSRSLGGVPVDVFRRFTRSLLGFVWHTLKGNTASAFDHELSLCFHAGVLRQRWADRYAAVPIDASSGQWLGDTMIQRSPGREVLDHHHHV